MGRGMHVEGICYRWRGVLGAKCTVNGSLNQDNGKCSEKLMATVLRIDGEGLRAVENEWASWLRYNGRTIMVTAEEGRRSAATCCWLRSKCGVDL
eukprot:6198039-Pleurochrysis_carterae.AAC.2